MLFQERRLGFTLIELLVVMSVIGLIVGLGVPAMSSYSRSIKLKATTRKVIRLLSYARSVALSSHENHSIEYDSDQNELTIINMKTDETLEQKVTIPSSINLSASVGGDVLDELQLIFKPTGSLDGRTTVLMLSNQSKTHSITVTGATGAVIVE